MQLRIMLADDEDNYRGVLRSIVESRSGWQVVGEAANRCDAEAMLKRVRPDVLILDYRLPELDGIGTISRIRHEAPLTEIVLLSMLDLQSVARQAVDAGVRGYVLKSRIVKDLMPAIESASEHRMYLSYLDAELDGAPPSGPH